MTTTKRRGLLLAIGVIAGFLLSFVAGLAVGFRLGQPSVRLSPLDTVQLVDDGRHATITYSRPYMRKREIFGALVPYGEVWRTGANEATSLVTDADVLLDEVTIPAGTYTLYTIPRHATWTLIVSRQTGQWGTVYEPDQDLVRVEMKSQHLEQPVEQFTILFEPAHGGWRLVLEWETTRASVPFAFL